MYQTWIQTTTSIKLVQVFQHSNCRITIFPNNSYFKTNTFQVAFVSFNMEIKKKFYETETSTGHFKHMGISLIATHYLNKIK